jgi:CSLREA domain-containing protein
MSKILVRSSSFFLILSILLSQFGLKPARAAENFLVNSTADAVDATPGDGLCLTDQVVPVCTLRAAVQETNALTGPDTITLWPGTYTLALAGAFEDEAATGDLDITDDLTITGAGMTTTVIDANSLDRALHQLGGSLILSDLKIQNGLANPGAGLLVDGVSIMENYGQATVSRVAFTGNRATSDASDGTGGGIHITDWSSADISYSQFINNEGFFGGGAVSTTNNGAVFSITDSTFESNTSHFGGGALYSNGEDSSVWNSTFTNNSADTGGAIHSNATSVTISNSTFVGNSAVNHGAIDSRVGLITVNYSTFYGNTASGFGDSLGSQPGQGGSLQVSNSIISGTDLDNCAAITDLGNNLSWPSGNNCPGTQADPLLDTPPLNTPADNGGSTKTIALMTGSPAIDAGNVEFCPTADQRGVIRPQGAACDIGAYEASSINVFNVTNVNDSGEGSLRQAILDANATPNAGAGPDEIHFNIPSAGEIIQIQTILPISAVPAITEAVVIDGYTQPYSSPNSLAVGDNAVIMVELNGDNCGCAQALLVDAGSTVRGLSISGGFNNGIEVNGSGNTIAGNFIGLKVDGSASGVIASGVYINNSSDNIIGGGALADRNVISANRDGIFIAAGAANASGNLIQGNYIGTNLAGTGFMGNSQRGIFVGGFGFTASDNIIRNNLISGNGHFGVLLRDASVMGTLVQGNLIGVTADGTGVLRNGSSESLDDGLAGTEARAGLYIAGPNNTIGGTTRIASGNVIANNAGAGVSVVAGTGNTIRSNDIFSNDGLGIDLAHDGVTFNHEGLASGPNNYQNFPVLTLATSTGETLRVGGFLEAEPNENYAIDVFGNMTCDSSFFGEAQSYLGSINVTTGSDGVAIFDTAPNNNLPVGVPEPHGVSVTATGSDGTSEFSYCRPVATPNLNWFDAQALSFDIEQAASVHSQTQQYMTDIFQEKWFKFPATPGGTVTVTLTSLPGSAVSLHRDPNPIYEDLINPENGELLSSQAQDAAFLPSGSLPSGSLPSGSLPSGSLPSGSLPSGSLPTGYLPSGSLPSGSLPSGSLPSGSLPSGSLPSGSLPSGSLPSGSLPSGSLPSGSLPSGSLPSGSLPSGSLPSGSLPSGSLPSGSLPSGSLDAFATAARNSLLGISMDPYATVQTIERNTYDLNESLYVRVVGPYNLETPFTLDVTVVSEICSGVGAVPTGTLVTSGVSFPAGAYQTLILTDSNRLLGTSTEIENALDDLATLAARSDVNGIVVDLNATFGDYPRVASANAEADAHLGCAFAKNTVATEINNVVKAYLAQYPSLQYIVLAGGADVIPFFQTADVAGLANEKDYVPPVLPSTMSDAGLETNLVQGQDAYGSNMEFTQAGHTLALPELAVGRLVDRATDISAAINAYIDTDGMIIPSSSLVTGYDFVGDAAEAMKVLLDGGTNSSADTLIQAPGLPPTDSTAWTADQLLSKLNGSNYDIAVLTGHFSAGSLLAADYLSELTAADVAASSANLTDVLIMALGCHGGYSIPASDVLDSLSPDPDWAKVFLREGAAGYISATGYAYGDTELKEYGERLFLLFAEQLRTGSGPVSVGQALVNAKLQYLAETAQLTGIDQKTLVEMTLYGLPMMKVDMPGDPLPAENNNSIVGDTTPVDGANFGLTSSSVSLSPTLTTNTKTLQNLSEEGTVLTTYLSGADGVVVNPFEPIYPKEIDNVSVSGEQLRGVAFRGGSYTDEAGVIPLTSSPTTETSTAHLSYNTPVFYPTQLWSANYVNAFSGGSTSLITFPAQFRSSALGVTDGTLRTFTSLDIELYYLPSNWTSTGSPETKAAAVSAAPRILGVSGVQTGNDINFSANAVADGSAGVQAVWVLYTGKPGSPYHGNWTALDLDQDDEDSTIWQNTLSLQPGESAEDIVFMVQAVGGAGLTTLATNLGAYYNVSPENAGTPPSFTATSLTFTSAPTSGTYFKNSTFDVLLQSNGLPIQDALVTLDIGGQQVSATTDAVGAASLSLKLLVRPGNYTAQVSFRGDGERFLLGSNATSPLIVNKDTTTVTVTPDTPPTIIVSELQPTPFVAVVNDSSGRVLGGRTVFFIVSNATHSYSTAVIADYLGKAALGEVPLPPGNYTVDAYFNGTIPVTPTLNLSDDYYHSSSHLGESLTILDDTTPPTITAMAKKADNTSYTAGTWTNQTVTVHFTCSDAGSGIASCPADQVFSTDGTFTASGTATDKAGNTATATFGPIKIDKTAPTLSPGISPNPVYLNGTALASTGANDTGSGIASQSCGTISTNTVGTKTVTCTATDNAGNITTATTTYQVIYRFDGFLQPINDTGHSQVCSPPCPISIFKGGSTVPAKFQLKDANGNIVQSTTLPIWITPQQGNPTAAPIDESIFTDPATSGTNFQWDGSSKYIYNWGTHGFAAGYYWRIGVTLDDGMTYYVIIGLR